MEKEKLISKFNIKDYNNQLEKILTKKNFSEDTKNLLLSMLYKIENSYQDYSRVNSQAQTKKEILEKILNIIANDCEQITIVKAKESKSIVEEKKIETYLNEKKMLYAILEVRSSRFTISKEHKIIKKSLEKTLNQGYSISASEIIRDFDGWAWNIEVNEIENILANFVYQILKILFGNDFLEEWQTNSNNDYINEMIEILTTKYNETLAKEILKKIKQISLINTINNDDEERAKLIKMQEEMEQTFKLLDNKAKYLENLETQKKIVEEKIKTIDEMLNNDIKLKKGFIARNEVLDMNDRIFSLSDFVDLIEDERKDLIKELKEYNKNMEPMIYIKKRNDIENKLELLNEIDLKTKDQKIYNCKVKELLKIICEIIKIDINNVQEKENIIKLIYKIRYFGLIYVNKNKQIKDMIDLNTIQRMIITKACKEKIITIFSKNIKENYEIVKNILQTDIIELENISLKIMQESDKTILNMYDEDNLYKTVEIPLINELYVKQNKKIKVFI